MLGQNDLMIKMAATEEYINEEGDSEIKNFLEHVIRRTEEILSQSSFGSNDRHVSEVLTHVDLLERTIRVPDQLATIVTDETDVKQLDDLRLLHGGRYYQMNSDLEFPQSFVSRGQENSLSRNFLPHQCTLLLPPSL